MLKNKDEILKKSHLSKEDFELLLSILETKIETIPLEEFASFFSKAESLLGNHLKDVPYFALALKLNCKIFSGDKTLKKLFPDIVKNPQEILIEFGL